MELIDSMSFPTTSKTTPLKKEVVFVDYGVSSIGTESSKPNYFTDTNNSHTNNNAQSELNGGLNSPPNLISIPIVKEEDCLEMDALSSVGTECRKNTADEILPQTNKAQIEQIECLGIPLTSVKKETDCEQHERLLSADTVLSNNVGDEVLPVLNNVLIKEEEDLDDTTFQKGLGHIKEEQLSCGEDSFEDENTQGESMDLCYHSSQQTTDTGCTFNEANPGHNFGTVKVDPSPEDCSSTEQNLLCSVFIKEEPDEDLHNEFQQTNCERQDDETFGHHFLFQCMEPNMSEQQHGNQTTRDSTNGNRNTSSLETESDQHYRDQTEKIAKKKYSVGKWKKRICKQCNYATYNPHKWKLHHDMYEHDKRKKPILTLYCQFCPYQTTIRALLRQHVMKKHNFGFHPIDCPYCSFQSLSIPEMEAHIASRHNSVKVLIDCPYCDHKSRSSCNLNYHIMAKHTNEKRYACFCCDYKCIQAQCMRRHILKIHHKTVRDDSLIRIIK